MVIAYEEVPTFRCPFGCLTIVGHSGRPTRHGPGPIKSGSIGPITYSERPWPAHVPRPRPGMARTHSGSADMLAARPRRAATRAGELRRHPSGRAAAPRFCLHTRAAVACRRPPVRSSGKG